jgi:hypothetical protein
MLNYEDDLVEDLQAAVIRNDMLIDAITKRLNDVERAMKVKPDLDDQFDLGIDCRLTNEHWWLSHILKKFEGN